MRTCGECTLCCKLEYVTELEKPRNTWCKHCDKGCTIYEKRPPSCEKFKCMWLTGDLPEWMRPDKVHGYAVDMGEYAKIVFDPDGSFVIWPPSRELVKHVVESGKHAIVMNDNQLTFLCGNGKDIPKKLMIEWVL